jgi:hypothetical protein
VEFTIRWKIIG